ncbi:type I-B CRISPR-associated protein Cas5 [Desulfallas sp. Bu1-1]|uniref:type I-B CRISPR-associated protein Cas5b n=1 Tax=Desulfallas sp. Bu1-1 TaxID=2787620 RepID=UPI0018A05AED|nr:type I-B CRISPR-associated protein Cas5b [Desulfallas sp. Bu1-1]MBF7082174.1 type I-B CRISPR-associated protein Cas5 [Desulfallas sp. Bu1-1]
MTLVFEVTSELAMFRKGYTTTSMVSYPFMPPIALAGLIGAITGLDNGAGETAEGAQFWTKLQGTQVAVAIRSPINWFITAVNLLKYKSGSGEMGEHIQPKHQFLKRPRYRVYVRGGDIYQTLKTQLSQGECVFTPYLGVAYALADIKFLGEFQEEEVDALSVDVHSVVPVPVNWGSLDIDILKSRAVYKEIVPVKLDESRALLTSSPVLYSDIGKAGVICLRNKGDLQISKVGDDVIAWFAPW